MELFLNKIDNDNYKQVFLSDNFFTNPLKEFIFSDNSTTNILYVAKIVNSFNYGDSLSSLSDRTSSLEGKRCLLKSERDNKIFWTSEKIEKANGLFFILSNNDKIYTLSDIFILDSIEVIDISQVSFINLPRSLFSYYHNCKINDFNDFRVNQLISQIRHYASLASFALDSQRNKLVLFGKCKEIAEVINQHYEKVDENNKQNNLFVRKEEKLDDKVNLKEKHVNTTTVNTSNTNTRTKDYFKDTILYEKKLYDIVKPKIEHFKKLKHKFEIKTFKDNQIKVDIICNSESDLYNIKAEIDLKREYFELLLSKDHFFLKNKAFPSLNYFLNSIKFESFDISLVNDEATGVELIGKAENVNKFKAMIKNFLEGIQKEKKIKEDIRELNQIINQMIN